MITRYADKILIPTDFSHESMAALEVGIRRACEAGATLLVMHVMETHWYDVNGVTHAIGSLTDAHWLHARKQLNGLCEILRDTGTRVVPILRQGAVAQEIVTTARKYEVDMILMASGGNAERPVGKVTARVLENAPCEVWSVKGRPGTCRRVRASIGGIVPVPMAG